MSYFLLHSICLSCTFTKFCSQKLKIVYGMWFILFMCFGPHQVLLSGLADTWPARTTWTVDQLSMKYGDTTFKISQKGVKNISMKFNDYVSYMKVQCDEDPLYIFDAKVLCGCNNIHSTKSFFFSRQNWCYLSFYIVWGSCTRIVEGLQRASSISRGLICCFR